MTTRFIGLMFLFLTLPLLAIIGIAIVLTDGMPVLYIQRRTGYRGRTFVLYKFRTMVPNAEKLKKKYSFFNESQGPTFKMHRDPRFSNIGMFLSHTGLDELPQLWNVVRGEMAFIGPRPFPVREAAKLSSWMRKREDILPGIISPAILTGTYHKDFIAWMKSDVAYAREKGIRADTVLVVRMVPFLVGLILREVRGGR